MIRQPVCLSSACKAATAGTPPASRLTRRQRYDQYETDRRLGVEGRGYILDDLEGPLPWKMDDGKSV